MKKKLKDIILRLRGEIPTSELIKNGLIVESNFNRRNDCIIDYSHCWLIEIGNNVTLAPKVHILAHDASTINLIGYTKIGKVEIGDNVFIGAGSIILPNVKIGNNSIIGAGSVVSKDIPENTVYAGNPVKYICSIDEYKNKILELKQDVNSFDSTYTLRHNINEAKKRKMKNILSNTIGFVE